MKIEFGDWRAVKEQAMKIKLFTYDLELDRLSEEGALMSVWRGRLHDCEFMLTEEQCSSFQSSSRVTIYFRLNFLGFDNAVIQVVGRTLAETCSFFEQDVRQLRTKLEALTRPPPESTRVDSAKPGP